MTETPNPPSLRGGLRPTWQSILLLRFWFYGLLRHSLRSFLAMTENICVARRGNPFSTPSVLARRALLDVAIHFTVEILVLWFASSLAPLVPRNDGKYSLRSSFAMTETPYPPSLRGGLCPTWQSILLLRFWFYGLLRHSLRSFLAMTENIRFALALQ